MKTNEFAIVFIFALAGIGVLCFQHSVQARQPVPCYRPTEGPYMLGTQDCQRPLPLTPTRCPFPQ